MNDNSGLNLRLEARAGDLVVPDLHPIAATAVVPKQAEGRWRAAKLVLMAIWLAAVLGLISRHAMWRDEVRALSLALRGSDVFGMVAALRGEGHPAVWYLLLRVAHDIAPTPLVLPVVAAVVGVAGAALLVFASPFRWPFLAVVLFGHAYLYEYIVKARNYGISTLVLWATVITYSHYGAGFLTGIILFILANCNVHSDVLVLAFLGFLALEQLRRHGLQRGGPLRDLIICTGLALAGVAVSFATVYPTIHDAAAGQMHVDLGAIAAALALPGSAFGSLFFILQNLGLTPFISSLVLFGSTLTLVRAPSAWIASLAALLALSVFFHVVYPGSYRHQALWLFFLLAMNWVALRADPRAVSPPSRFTAGAERIGVALLVVLFALQLVPAADAVADAVREIPESRGKDLAALVAGHPELQQSWIVADPDYLIEELSYDLSNPTYLLRERRPGNVVTFTRRAQLDLNLDDVLETALRLRADSVRPVLILLSKPLTAGTAETVRESYIWTFSTPADQVARFRAATRLLAAFPPARTDESFDVYVLD